MNQKTVVALIIVAIVLVGGGIILSQNNQGSLSDDTQKTKSSSALEVDREAHGFGEIDIFGGNVETEFILTNNGTEDVVVLAGTTSCGCTEGNLDGISFGMHKRMSGTVTIKAGESKNVTAIYDPLAHGPNATGSVTRQLFLKTNSKVTPEIELRITADVVEDPNG
jgi:hypothetical protein